MIESYRLHGQTRSREKQRRRTTCLALANESGSSAARFRPMAAAGRAALCEPASLGPASRLRVAIRDAARSRFERCSGYSLRAWRKDFRLLGRILLKLVANILSSAQSAIVRRLDCDNLPAPACRLAKRRAPGGGQPRRRMSRTRLRGRGVWFSDAVFRGSWSAHADDRIQSSRFSALDSPQRGA